MIIQKIEHFPCQLFSKSLFVKIAVGEIKCHTSALVEKVKKKFQLCYGNLWTILAFSLLKQYLRGVKYYASHMWLEVLSQNDLGLEGLVEVSKLVNVYAVEDLV